VLKAKACKFSCALVIIREILWYTCVFGMVGWGSMGMQAVAGIPSHRIRLINVVIKHPSRIARRYSVIVVCF